MRSQIICDRCKKNESDFMSLTPKNWEGIHDRDLCPDCVKLYNKLWKKKIEEIENAYQVEINKKCKDRDTTIETMFKTYLKI